MAEKDQKIKEIRELLDGEPKKITKRVSIIFDGKQYTIRIPRELAEKSKIDPVKDEFEFTLETQKEKDILPVLYGDLVEKEKKSD